MENMVFMDFATLWSIYLDRHEEEETRRRTWSVLLLDLDVCVQ